MEKTTPMNIPFMPIQKDFSVNGRFTQEFFLFFVTFLRRFLAYFASVKAIFFYGLSYLLFYTGKIKRVGVKMLMRRHGALNNPPRVTVATVTVGVFLSLIPVDISIHSATHVSDQNAEPVLAAKASLATTIVPQRIVHNEVEHVPSIDEVVTHTVKSGETLSYLSEKYLVPVDAIAYVNDISTTHTLQSGDTLEIPPVDGITHTVKTGESVASIAEKYNTSPQSIVDANLLTPPFHIIGGDVLVVPGAQIPDPQPTPAPKPVVLATTTDTTQGGLSLESVPTGAGYMMPTAGTITQYYSYYHNAIDIADGCGNAIWASSDGVVSRAGWLAGGYGYMVQIEHPDGRTSQYAHMSQVAASAGQQVSKGQVIGYTGATGIAYGCHLHFVVLQGGRAVNPLSVL